MAKAKKKPFWPYGLLLFSVTLFLDQYTKYIISTTYSLGQSTTVFSWLWFTYLQNTGTSWGLLQNTNTAFIFISIIAFGVLLYYHEEFKTTVEKICFAFILAGLWGNLIDRFSHGFVIDFIDLGWFPVFNIADSAISVAIIVFLLEQWRKQKY